MSWLAQYEASLITICHNSVHVWEVRKDEDSRAINFRNELRSGCWILRYPWLVKKSGTTYKNLKTGYFGHVYLKQTHKQTKSFLKIQNNSLFSIIILQNSTNFWKFSTNYNHSVIPSIQLVDASTSVLSSRYLNGSTISDYTSWTSLTLYTLSRNVITSVAPFMNIYLYLA